ncbi:MAG TPA: hypothetical protein VKW78_10250 [Terriglobales bacterium]|nr:hypothetical protein [Terriglobales bacterium]
MLARPEFFRDPTVELVLIELIHARAQRRKALRVSGDLLLTSGLAGV